MSYNPTKDYGFNAASTDRAQQNIAGIEDSYWKSILGGSDANGKVLDQDELRDQLSRMRALLGEIRVRSKEIVQEQLSELEARKDKGFMELAKA